MAVKRLVPSLLGSLVCGILAACFSGTGPALVPEQEEGGASIDLTSDGGLGRFDASLGDPFAIDGLTPSHGPFSGGTRSRIDGRGFSSKLRVFVGGVEISGPSLLASDPTRAAIVTPPGVPGFVDVKIIDDGTSKERVLKNGFYYDAIVVVPDSGATSGGTRIVINGSGTNWGNGTTVTIGGTACTDVVVSSPTKLECVTASSTPGSKDVVITPAAAPPIQARDAFTYSDSVDGYRGGLSGGALSGRVKVLAYDLVTGGPIPSAYAIVGENLGTAKIAKTTSNGVVEIDGITGDKATVTVAGKCHQPMTFVDVPVDTVTVYLAPVLDPSCGSGDPVIVSPRQRYGGTIKGQLVFPGAGEFERAGWTTVPLPTKPTERRAAYVFEASPFPNQPFGLPAIDQAITPDNDGTNGYDYSILVLPGNSTIYVIGGLEDRSESPPKFVPYAMGVARGVAVPAQAIVEGVDIKMDVLFDHQVTVVAQPPAPGPKGPDRFTATIATTLGSAGYALLPRGSRSSTLPVPATIPFVGVPALDNAMAGEQYVLGGVAATGYEQTLPSSVVARVRTTDANNPVSLGGFLGVPVPGQPSAGVWNGTHVEFSGANGPTDLEMVQISSGGGLVQWTILAPGGRTSFDVPDLSAVVSPDPLGLRHGAIQTSVYVARIEQFDYARLRFGQLNSAAWNAYAYDDVGGVY